MCVCTSLIQIDKTWHISNPIASVKPVEQKSTITILINAPKHYNVMPIKIIKHVILFIYPFLEFLW